MVTQLQEFQFLYEICSLLIKAQEDEEIFSRVTENLCQFLGMSACSFWRAKTNMDIGQQRIGFFLGEQNYKNHLPTLDFKVASRVIREKKAFIGQKLNDLNLNDMDQVVEQNLRIAAFPLYIKGELIGVLNCWYKNENGLINTIETITNRIIYELAFAVKNFTDSSDFQRKRLKRELEIAKKMQSGLIPREIPNIKGISIAARTLSAYEIGGDYVDLFVTKGKNLGIAIGDVMGKGIPAALWSSVARATLRMAARDDRQPHLVIGDVNNTLFQDLSSQGTFLTLINAWYEPLNRTLLFSNAGHLNPILIQAASGRHKILKAHGPYIGGLENHPYQLGGARLQAEDIVLFYTDGLTETVNPEDHQFAVNYIVDILMKNSFYKASEMIDNLYLHLGQIMGDKPQHDDISCILLKIES